MAMAAGGNPHLMPRPEMKPLTRNQKALFALMMGIVLTSLQTTVLASGFAEAWKTAGIEGSVETLSNFDFLGVILTWTITACSAVGLVMLVGQMMINILYLMMKPIFNQIAEYQEEDAGQGFIGVKGMWQNISGGKRGTGFNVVIGIMYTIAPNVRKLSSYDPQRIEAGLDPDDGLMAYLIKSAPKNFAAILILILSFDGTLIKGFITVAEAASVVADHAVETNLADMADKWASSGQGYSFTLGESKSDEALFAEKLAKKLYFETLKATGANLATDKQRIGLNAENFVYANVFGTVVSGPGMRAKLNELLKGAGVITETSGELGEGDVKRLKYQIVVNGNPNRMPGEIEVNVQAKEGSPGGRLTIGHLTSGTSFTATENQLYVHIFLIKGKVANTKFFKTAPVSGNAS